MLHPTPYYLGNASWLRPFLSLFFIFPALAFTQQPISLKREIEMPSSKDSVTNLFYDKVTGRVYRYFYNKTDSVEQGYLKYPRDEKGDEIHTTQLYECGVLNESGGRYNFGHNEILISVFNNTIVTFTQKHYIGKTIAKSYQITNNSLLLLDTLHFNTPFVYGTQAFDGEYVLFNEGLDVNTNFIIFNNHLKYVCTHSPFYGGGYYSYKIEAREQAVIIAAAATDSIRVTSFDRQFKVQEDKKIKLKKPQIQPNEAPFFGEFVGFGKTFIFTKIIRKNNDNVMLTSAYNERGQFLWEKEYVPNQKMGFKWNYKTGKMFAFLFKDKKPYIGLFDEEKGRFIDSLNYEEYYRKLYPNKENNIKIRPIGAQWLDGNNFIFVFGEMKRQIHDGVGYVDNVFMLMNGSTSSITSQNILTQRLKGIYVASKKDKINIFTFNNIYEY